MKKILLLIIFIITLLSCSREIECQDPPINLSFIAIPQTALDTIVLRKFTKDDLFRNLVDSLKVKTYITNRGDTSIVSLGDPFYYVTPGFDWQIFLPAINRTVALTEINKRDKTGKCAAMTTDCFCDDEILGLKVDNQPGVLQTYPVYMLVIR
jgi:hypothetical protein